MILLAVHGSLAYMAVLVTLETAAAGVRTLHIGLTRPSAIPFALDGEDCRFFLEEIARRVALTQA